ncbi:nucleotidyltransferase family protein [Rhizobium leguminosarum]|uniref:nucleotidyltransferase family protein n=1 Tax=Rhizobium leguminosarum TaxID=384 RepID=UPI001C9678FD|nr:nucleotidyltransferase family protein [Rhizobium leguminosarum]MBY5472930.1 nucleotidyltransferase family protein [Rhizobium leguminosarum]
MNDEQFRQLQGIVVKSPLLSALLHDWDKIALPGAWLVAGAIAQTVWNHTFGLPPAHGINDIDIVYYDANDLSEDGEAEHAARVRRAFSDLPVWIDVKNEARVHLWYEGKFGYPIKPYTSTTDAIATFPTTATAVGLRPGNGSLELCAPFGLSDLLGGVVRPNKTQIRREIYEQKVTRWIKVWPGLGVVGWVK